MTTQPEVTYKLFIDGKDHILTINQLAQWVMSKRIKLDTRIYNNETECWINFQEYDRLIKIINAIYSQTKTEKSMPLNTFPAKQPRDEDTYKVLLDGRSHDLTTYRIERLLKNGTIKPDTQIYNNETECWINFCEHSGLNKRFNILGSEKNSLLVSETGTGSSPLLMECPKCNHSYSKRANKCPKCGNTASASPCNICKAEIPKHSDSCPECGDPDPFGGSPGVSLETPALARVNQKRETPTQARTDPPDQPTTSPEDRKKMNQFLRWTIIIGSGFGALFIVSLIHVTLGESHMRLYNLYVPMSAFWIAWYLTRFKEEPSRSSKYKSDVSSDTD